jgi:hypothetical protein
MQERNCKITGQAFGLSPEEVEAYQKFDLPMPTVCPQERVRRKLAFCNDGQFFWRKCDATGKKIYSAFPEQTGFPVVSADYWRSSQWDAMSYGMDFNFRRSFFEQYQELWQKVPRPAHVIEDVSASIACHHSWQVKSSFMVFDAKRSSNCYYCVGAWDSEKCVDCYCVSSCASCYECVHCVNSKNMRFAECCIECEDCWFMSYCTKCKHCLFCTGLEGKEYHLFNQPVTEQEYAAALRDWSFSARQKLEVAKETFDEFLSDKPIPHLFSDHEENNSGNYLLNCRSAVESFECSDCRNVIQCSALTDAEDCLEGLGFGGKLSQSAQFVSVGRGARNVVNCIECWDKVDGLTYCSFCRNSANLFACVGLSGKEYCILNCQYTKSGYAAQREKIVAHLKMRGVWGKFFPAAFSGVAYNHSAANSYMPLARIPAQMMGFTWDDSEEYVTPSLLRSGGDQTPGDYFSDMPATLAALDDEMVKNSVFICEFSGRPYRFTKEEVTMYRKFGVAPPVRAFEQRHRERVLRLSPRSMFKRKPGADGGEIYCSYPETWRRPVVAYSAWVKRSAATEA